jgi:hypothetical protein
MIDMSTEITSNKNGSLTFKKEDDPKKKKTGRKPVYIHKCSEKQQLERMRLIIVGNGNPETGLAFIAKANVKAISEIKEDITYIKNKLEETIIAASTAASSLEKYKLEVKSFEAGKDDAEEKAIIAENLAAQKRRDSWQRYFWVIMACLGIVSIWLSIWLSDRRSVKTNTKIDNLGVPIEVNTRSGEFVKTPDVEIKFWPKDFTGDTTKKEVK